MTIVHKACAGIEGNTHAHLQRWHSYLRRHNEPLPERFDHVAIGSPEEEALIFSFEWLPIDAPIKGFAPPYLRVIERVREALAR